MITDTCVCGAKFKSKQKDWVKESDDHLEFLRAHAVCRGGKRVVTVAGNRLEDRVTATQAAAANIGKVVRTATV